MEKSNNFDVKSNEELFKQALVEGVNRRIDKTIGIEKQIEEMVDDIDAYIESVDVKHWYSDELDEGLAQALYNADYRKQSEGEWISNRQTDELICNLCGAIAPVDCEKERFYKSNFCPNCGARMRGEKSE